MKYTALFAFFLILLIAAGYFYRDRMLAPALVETQEVRQLAAPSHCALSTQPCELPSGYRVQVLGDMKVLQPFIVQLDGSDIKDADIDFQMQEMDMGINHFGFKPVSAQRWQAKVIVPGCASGGMDWVATIDMKTNQSQGKRIVLPLTMHH